MSPRPAEAEPSPPFEGFPEEALDFFEGLAADNSKAYWTDHREVYERAVAGPMKALLAAAAPEFGAAKFFRPYRDVRFGKDKTPYKTHAAAVVGGDGEAARYVQFAADGLLVAGGYWFCTTAQARVLRDALAGDSTGPAAVRVLNRLQRDGFDIGGDELVRIPKPWDGTHPRAQWLRRKALSASIHHPPAEWLHTATALDRVVAGWRAVEPLNRWLEKHVGRPPRDDA